MITDYIENNNCINETSCMDREIGKVTGLDKGTNGSVPVTPRQNILTTLFDSSDEPKFSVSTKKLYFLFIKSSKTEHK